MKQVSLQEVDNYPVPDLLIPRVATEHGYTNDMAAKLVREAKRMLYLYTCTEKAISPSKHVDMAWHEMLMFTRFYKDFAQFIGVFIHHDPTPGPPDGGKLYNDTKKRYEEVFHEKPDPECWP